MIKGIGKVIIATVLIVLLIGYIIHLDTNNMFKRYVKKTFPGNQALKVYNIAQKSSVSLFSVGQGLGFCSGVVVKEDKNKTYVITCKHCISVTEEMLVENNKVESVICFTDDDLAYLIVEGKIPEKRSIKIAKIKPKIKADLYHIGYPVFKLFKSSGKLIRETNDWNWSSLNVIGGCSGGGIFNKKAQLVGIVWGSLVRHGISIYEPLQDVRNFLKRVDNLIK